MGSLRALAIMAVAIDLAESQKFVSMGLKQTRYRPSILSERDDVPQQDIDDNQTVGGYMIDAMIGTPAQKIQLFVDSGSSETWLLGSDAESCTDSCITPYDETSSTSYRSAAGQLSVDYKDNSSAEGDYIQDTIGLGGFTIEGATMGLATQTDINHGILGLGPGKTDYPQILDLMQDQGMIDAKAYSLDLDSGKIIFGGADTSRYTGELTILYALQDGDPINYSWRVGLYSLGASTSSSSTKQLMSDPFEPFVLLDSGTELTYLPNNLLNPLYDTWNVFLDDDDPYADCALANNDGENETYLEFRFYDGLDENKSDDATEGPVIRVPASDLVEAADSNLSSRITDAFPGVQNICKFGVRPLPSGISSGILGAPLLKNAYAVFDVDRGVMGMAPVVIGGGSGDAGDIVEITEGDASIESIKKNQDDNGGDNGDDDNFLSMLSSWEVTATATTPFTTTTVISDGGPTDSMTTLVITMTPSATATDSDDEDNSGQRRWGEQSAAGWTISVACAFMGLGLFLL